MGQRDLLPVSLRLPFPPADSRSHCSTSVASSGPLKERKVCQYIFLEFFQIKRNIEMPTILTLKMLNSLNSWTWNSISNSWDHSENSKFCCSNISKYFDSSRRGKLKAWNFQILISYPFKNLELEISNLWNFEILKKEKNYPQISSNIHANRKRENSSKRMDLKGVVGTCHYNYSAVDN